MAPGAVDLEAARAYLLEGVDAHYSGQDAQLLRERLHVVSQPYGEPELRAIQDELVAELVRANWGVSWLVGVGCMHSDAHRVELMLFNDSSMGLRHNATARPASPASREGVTRPASGSATPPRRKRSSARPVGGTPERTPLETAERDLMRLLVVRPERPRTASGRC